MREVLVTTLILGILVSHAVALAAKPPPRGSFMFFDSSHRCWLCDPGFHCVPCPRGRIPDGWSRECNPPTAEDCAANPGVAFPDPDMRHFWRCSGSGPPSFETCPCDNVFDLDQQTCVPVDMVDSFFCNVYVNVHPNPCDPSLPTPTTTTPTPGPPTPGPPTPGPPMPGPPTAPTIIPTTPGPPTAPTLAPTDPTNPWDTTTTTTTPWYTTTWPGPGPDTTTYSTTVGGGDDQNPPGGNVTTSTTVGEGDVQTPPGNGNGNGTTPAPCICVIWWPCPCNPCWHFPCHSCGGCMSPGMGPGMNMMGGMGGMGGMGMLG